MSNANDLTNCPFCGGSASIGISDDEGNMHFSDYEYNPYSGLTYQIMHDYVDNPGCPIATHKGEPIGATLYGSKESLINNWNNRFK